VRLLFVTQSLDPDHPVLAQTLDLVEALASRCEELVVLSQSVGHHPELPPNVRVLVFGAPSRPRRAAAFLRALLAELRRRPDAMLAHMVPLYVILAAPAAKLLRIRLLLWYTHWHAGRQLRLATRLANVVLSVSEGSFPLRTPKLIPTGHAIDVEVFSPGPPPQEHGPLRLLALGRTARWKGYETMLDGLEQAARRGLDAELEIRGPQLTDDERAHADELRERVAASPLLRERVRIEPPLPRSELPELLRGADALLSATQPRASETLDKVVYEAAAAALPVVASNTALADFLAGLPLELAFPARDAEALADRLLALAAAAPATRRETGLELRRRVVSGHSVGAWADAVARLVARQAPK
jgi:glycosyltransferase involved in cell wall biosynthesis